MSVDVIALHGRATAQAVKSSTSPREALGSMQSEII
jgi:hypothetical protein